MEVKYTYNMTIIEKAFLWLLYGVCTSFAISVLIFTAMPAKVTAYSLSDNGATTQGVRIQKHINWATDDYITLDRNITYEQAVELVKELNKTIK